MTKSKSTEAIATREEFAVLKQDPSAIASAIHENLGGEEIGPGDLDRIKIPSGGGTSWTVPTLAGDEDVKEFAGVIVGFKTVRSFWEKEFSGESNPPDCFSDDGATGNGAPGGTCARCPLNTWGSGKANEKACKERRLVFILRPGDFLPVVVSLPPASIAPFKKYLMRLSSQGVAYYSAVTRFALERDKNSGGIVFSKVEIALSHLLEANQVESIKAYAETIRPMLARVRDDADREVQAA